jgi:hypothetical protein
MVARLIAPHLVASRIIPQHRRLASAPAVVPSNSSACPWSGPNAAARTAAYAPVNRLPPASQTFSCFAQGNDPIYPNQVISPYLAKLNLKEIDDLLQSQLESLSNLY